MLQGVKRESLEKLHEAAKACFQTAFQGSLFIIATSEDATNLRFENQSTHPQDKEHSTVIHVDGHQSPPEISIVPISHYLEHFPSPSKENLIKTDAHIPKGICVWRSNVKSFERIFAGGRNFATTFISGHFTIAGDMAIMNRMELHDPLATTSQH